MVLPRENRLNTVYSSGLQARMAGWLFMPVFPVRKPVRAQPKGQCRETIVHYQMPSTVKKQVLRWLPMLLMVLCTGSGVLAADKTVPVVIREAESRSLTPMQQVAGTLISRHDARLAAQVEGQAVWVAEVGTRLARGKAATRLDDTLIREELAENEASVERALASVEFSRAELKRLEQLAEKSHAAESRLDQVRRDLAVARSELSAARARTDQSREKLQRTAILAPFDGVVTQRFIQAGEWADAGAAVVRLVDTAELEAQAWVPVTMLAHIREGMELKFTANGSRGTGKVRTLVPVGDRQSRLYEVRLVIDDGGWSPGQSVRLTVPTAAARTATVVPRDALVVRRDAVSVFRVTNDNVAEQLQVETGIADGDYIEVTGDVRAGDRIVIRGSERLRNGQAVSPSETLPGN
jgi:RND family efflux transporter MFP subunit